VGQCLRSITALKKQPLFTSIKPAKHHQVSSSSASSMPKQVLNAPKLPSCVPSWESVLVLRLLHLGQQRLV
jgi:hypothetical protein